MSTLLAFIAFAQEAAAETAAHEEHADKTLFYIFGGAAAVYAVVIAAIGITQHDFPRSEGTAKAVYAISTIVVLAAMASTLATN